MASSPSSQSGNLRGQSFSHRVDSGVQIGGKQVEHLLSSLRASAQERADALGHSFAPRGSEHFAVSGQSNFPAPPPLTRFDDLLTAGVPLPDMPLRSSLSPPPTPPAHPTASGVRPLPPPFPSNFVDQLSSLLAAVGFGVHPLESDSPSALPVPFMPADADCEPRRPPVALSPSSERCVFDAELAAAPAPGQRTARPRSSSLSRSAPMASAAQSQPASTAIDDWDPDDRETMLKSSSRPRFTESSGMKIRAFLEDSELFLRLCGRPRSRWGLFVLSWLGVNEGEKVRRSHLAEKTADYDAFKDGLITLFGRLEFEDHYREQLRNLRQAGSEAISDYAARTSDLCSRAYPNFCTESQLDLAVEHFVSGLADVNTRDFLRRERARRRIAWTEAVQMAQASELPLPSASSVAAVPRRESSAYA